MNRLELRVGTLTDDRAFVRISDAGGYCGEALLERSTLDAIANGAGLEEGDYLAVEARLLSRSRPPKRGEA